MQIRVLTVRWVLVAQTRTVLAVALVRQRQLRRQIRCQHRVVQVWQSILVAQ
jgi:hypothetical protein